MVEGVKLMYHCFPITERVYPGGKEGPRMEENEQRLAGWRDVL